MLAVAAASQRDRILARRDAGGPAMLTGTGESSPALIGCRNQIITVAPEAGPATGAQEDRRA